MSALFPTLQKIASLGIALVLITGLAFAPASPALAPKPVEAQWAVFDGSNFIQTTLSAIANTASQINTYFLQFKEMIGDGLAYVLINMVIEELIRSTTAWVASGFEGKPAFVQDLTGFLGDLADTMVGDFIWNSDALGFLCSPFSFNVKLALDIQYSNDRDYRRTSQCTLSGIGDNLNNFMGQSWDNFFQVSMNSSNNPYGAALEAKAGLAASVSSARGSATTQLSFGDGFFSKKDEDGNIITPGQTIQTQIADTLGIPGDRLAFADEINELIGALLTQLARGVLTEVGGGLAGLGQNGAGGTSLRGDNPFGNYNSSSASGAGFTRQFASDREREQEVSELNDRILDVVEDALSTCPATVFSITGRQLTDRGREATTDRARAQSNIACITAQERELAGLTDPTEIQQFLQRYQNGDACPQLHTIREVAELETVLAVPPGTDDDLLESMANQGNVVALGMLHENSCRVGRGGG